MGLVAEEEVMDLVAEQEEMEKINIIYILDKKAVMIMNVAMVISIMSVIFN
jgi:hypothetical protein